MSRRRPVLSTCTRERDASRRTSCLVPRCTTSPNPPSPTHPMIAIRCACSTHPNPRSPAAPPRSFPIGFPKEHRSETCLAAMVRHRLNPNTCTGSAPGPDLLPGTSGDATLEIRSPLSGHTLHYSNNDSLRRLVNTSIYNYTAYVDNKCQAGDDAFPGPTTISTVEGVALRRSNSLGHPTTPRLPNGQALYVDSSLSYTHPVTPSLTPGRIVSNKCPR